MNSNLAYKEKPRKELLNGETILISPRPSIDHNRVASNIYYAFHTFLTINLVKHSVMVQMYTLLKMTA